MSRIRVYLESRGLWLQETAKREEMESEGSDISATRSPFYCTACRFMKDFFEVSGGMVEDSRRGVKQTALYELDYLKLQYL